MRTASTIAATLAVLIGFSIIGLRTASAAFHCMRIHAVLASYNGNDAVQYVELRMTMLGQADLGPPGAHTIRFYSGNGTLVSTFTFPGDAATSTNGDSATVLGGRDPAPWVLM